MRVKATRKQSRGERMAAVLGIPVERIQLRIRPMDPNPTEDVIIEIGDAGPDSVFVVSGDVPVDKQDAAQTLARTMLSEEQ